MIPNKKKKSAKKGSLYFDPLINQFGDISRVPAKVLKDKLYLLVRDFARGNLIYEKYSKYFTAALLFHLKEYVETEYYKKSKIAASLNESVMLHLDDASLRNLSGEANIEAKGYELMNYHIQMLWMTGDLQTAMTLIPHAVSNNYKYLF